MHQRWLIPVISSLVAGVLAPAAPAQTAPSDQVTVTAHPFPVPFKSLARTVEVITREEIENLPVASVTDLLRYAASVEVRSRGPFGVQSDLSIRGSTFDQVLVLVDGIRLNDAQTGHHNGDIPVALEDVERVEILYGSGSSLYGADAVGGVINVVTRRGERRSRAGFSAGQFGLLTGYGSVPLSHSRALGELTLWGDRSDGFAPDRDFQTLGIRLQGRLGRAGRFQLAHLDKRFGAEGFYGPSPSREWTRQSLLAATSPVASGEGWTLSTTVSFRTHGDHFLWDVERPGYAENFHRDSSLDTGMALDWSPRGKTRVNLGGSAGGDWIDSTNLGVHRYRRSGLYFEVEQRLGDRFVLYPGLRYDAFSSFDDSWSPSLSGLWWLSGALKLRASAGRSFRIPTFTERFYTDPNHQADPSLEPERAVGFEAGADWLPSTRWLAAATVFSRHQREAIDWVRADAAQRWHTANIRSLRTDGLEVSLRRFTSGASWFGFQYTYLNVRPGELDLQSKYVLEYARHSLTMTTALPLPLGLIAGHHLSYRRKRDGSDYWVADLRLSRRISVRTRVYVEVTNYLDSRYEAIPGVAMPPSWLRFGLAF